MSTFPLEGSERSPIPGARSVGRADPAERLEVTLLLRRRAAVAFADAAVKLHRRARPRLRISRRDFVETFGSDGRDVALVTAFVESCGLYVAQRNDARRTLVVAGTVAQAERAFGVALHTFEYADGTYRGRVGTVGLPGEIRGIVTAVLGLDNRPQAKPHIRLQTPAAVAGAAYTPAEIAALYGFAGAAAPGQTIALIELGGGFRPADLRAYFGKLGLPVPRVTPVSVDHARNQPAGGVAGPDGEVALDIEVAGSVAPHARIVVYFAPNTDAGFINAVTTAVHDEKHAPSVISIGWGNPEAAWTRQARAALDDALAAAALLGVSVCVASGDHGSSDGLDDGHEHVDFPASSPFVLACGGTRIETAGAALTGESAWNDSPAGGSSGGGESACFDLPFWQSGLQLTLTGGVSRPLEKRGVPDVAGDAAPGSGYRIRVDGSDLIAGGTSAVASLWAALIACANAAGGDSLGFVNPLFYAAGAAFRDVVGGDNGGYAATLGWDGCTGLGSPAPEAFAAAASLGLTADPRALLAPR